MSGSSARKRNKIVVVDQAADDLAINGRLHDWRILGIGLYAVGDHARQPAGGLFFAQQHAHGGDIGDEGRVGRRPAYQAAPFLAGEIKDRIRQFETVFFQRFRIVDEDASASAQASPEAIGRYKSGAGNAVERRVRQLMEHAQRPPARQARHHLGR